MHRLAGVNAGGMPGLERLGYQAAYEPIAHRLAAKGVALASGTGGKCPVRERAKFLFPSDVHAQLLEKIVGVIAGRIEVTAAPEANTVGDSVEPALDILERVGDGRRGVGLAAWVA